MTSFAVSGTHTNSVPLRLVSKHFATQKIYNNREIIIEISDDILVVGVVPDKVLVHQYILFTITFLKRLKGAGVGQLAPVNNNFNFAWLPVAKIWKQLYLRK